MFFNLFQTVLFRFVLFFVWQYVNARVSMSVGPLLLWTLRNYNGTYIMLFCQFLCRSGTTMTVIWSNFRFT